MKRVLFLYMNIFDLIIKDKKDVNFDDIHLSDENKVIVNALLKEYTYREELSTYGLQVNHKILLHGASGCGKTMLAKALAAALNINILILNLSNIINARIGETSQHIKQVFEKAIREKAILFLDEFDQIGKQRLSDENDVGEMRRLVNSVIQQLDYLPETVLLIAATNHLDIIDHALVRRFQICMNFDLPTTVELDRYYDSLLLKFPDKWRAIARKYEVSFAEAKDYLFTALKALIIQDIEAKQYLVAEE